jgi:hypothetical protein
MGLSGIQLRIAYQDISPLVTGILHPLVVIPVAAISGLTTDQLKAIIMHELAHIKRYDHFMIILEALGRQVLFFNPVSWMLLREIEKERENSCDDVVVRANNNPINYIKALTMIQEMNIKNSAPSNALTGKSNQLLNRIKRIANSDSKQSVVFKLTAIVFLTAVLSVSAMALVIQEQRDVKVHADKQVISQPDSVKNNTKTKGHNPDKKKITVVIQDDSIKHMTVNGKPVKGKEMEAYADELKKMQEELQKSKMELDQVSRKLNEAQFELQFAQKDFHIDHFPPVPPVPGFNPEDINVEIMAEISKNHMSREELETILHDKAFTDEMKKAHEEALKAHEEAWKEQMEYWRTHQDEIEKAKEEAAKAFEEFRKNYKHETEQEFWLHHGPDVPAPPMPGMMPEPEAPQAIPHMEMPEKPEKSETPAPSHQEEETVKHNSADKDAENDTELNSKLKELEE